jgi:hypothetical protein
VTCFYQDEEDPPSANGNGKVQHYTLTEMEQAYYDSMVYCSVLEEELRGRETGVCTVFPGEPDDHSLQLGGAKP